MDLLIRLIEFIVRSALEQNKRNNAPLSPPPQASTQAAPRPRPQLGTPISAMRSQPSQQASSQPLVPQSKIAPLDPAYDGEGWRLALTVLALIALAVIVGAWFAVTQGWL